MHMCGGRANVNWQAYDYYLFAAAALIGTFAAAILLVRVLAALRWAVYVAGMAGMVPPFINVLGALFDLTLAFLANDTWGAQSVNTKAIAPGWLKAAICSNVGLNTVVVTSVSEASRNP